MQARHGGIELGALLAERGFQRFAASLFPLEEIRLELRRPRRRAPLDRARHLGVEHFERLAQRGLPLRAQLREFLIQLGGELLDQGLALGLDRLLRGRRYPKLEQGFHFRIVAQRLEIIAQKVLPLLEQGGEIAQAQNL